MLQYEKNNRNSVTVKPHITLFSGDPFPGHPWEGFHWGRAGKSVSVDSALSGAQDEYGCSGPQSLEALMNTQKVRGKQCKNLKGDRTA